MKAAKLALMVLAVTALIAACSRDDATPSELVTVTIGAPMGDSEIRTLGVPTDPDTGLTAVATAELIVWKSSVSPRTRVYFDSDGMEKDSSDGASPVLLTPENSSAELKLKTGTYDFELTARDNHSPKNDLAYGELLWQSISTGENNFTILLRSMIGSASLSDHEPVMPNQSFDVALTVRPPGRPDLRVPTSDYLVTYTVTSTSGNFVSHSPSPLGVRVYGPDCGEITIEATVSKPDGTEQTTAQQSVPVNYFCPPNISGISVDLIPPYVSITSPEDGSSATRGNYVIVRGLVNDAQSGVSRVDLYDGVVLLGSVWEGSLTEDAGGMYAWELEYAFFATEERDYVLTAVAIDKAGNESRTAITVTVTAP